MNLKLITSPIIYKYIFIYIIYNIYIYTYNIPILWPLLPGFIAHHTPPPSREQSRKRWASTSFVKTKTNLRDLNPPQIVDDLGIFHPRSSQFWNGTHGGQTLHGLPAVPGYQQPQKKRISLSHQSKIAILHAHSIHRRLIFRDLRDPSPAARTRRSQCAPWWRSCICAVFSSASTTITM